MVKRDFEPKLGKPSNKQSHKNQRLFKLVVRETAKSASPRARRAPLTKRPVAELARGKGSMYALLPPNPGWRQVIVKARIARHGTSDLGAARAHQYYIQRDGVAPDGQPGKLYDRERDDVDGGDFLERQKDDHYQFRFIVSPEDSASLPTLKPFVRDLMASMEHDLHTQLDWVAVDHFNTGHPHTHIIIRGRDDQGQDLVMSRDYISHGIRNRARDLVSLELGPEGDLERIAKLRKDMTAERFTQLDRGIVNSAEQGILTLSAAPEPDNVRAAFRAGRLRSLERMGLAEEKQAGVWAIRNDMETTLRRMGERGDKMKTMFRVMREAGLDRPAGEYAIFDGASRKEPAIGRVVGAGFADEINDRHYVVVDGVDGRVHYAETGKLGPGQVLGRGQIVALTGAGGKRQMRNAQIEVLSYWELDRLPNADAATWLDKVIVEGMEPATRETGVGLEVNRVIAARKEWLLAHGFARRASDGGITPNPDMMRTLSQRGIDRTAQRLSNEFAMPYAAPIEGIPIIGLHVRTIDLPTMKLAVIKGRDEFTLIPWRPELQQMRGKQLAIGMHDRAITLSIARGRDLGLSR